MQLLQFWTKRFRWRSSLASSSKIHFNNTTHNRIYKASAQLNKTLVDENPPNIVDPNKPKNDELRAVEYYNGRTYRQFRIHADDLKELDHYSQLLKSNYAYQESARAVKGFVQSSYSRFIKNQGINLVQNNQFHLVILAMIALIYLFGHYFSGTTFLAYLLLMQYTSEK